MMSVSGYGVCHVRSDPAVTRCYFNPVPQRRCRNRSQGENRILSAINPISTITIITPITWSMADNSGDGRDRIRSGW